MAIMDMAAAKKMLAEKGIKMPWEKGHEAQVSKRTPEAIKQVAEVNDREQSDLDDAQRKVLEQVIGKKGKKEEAKEGAGQ